MASHLNTTHGHSRSCKHGRATPTYNTWAMMKNRCLNSKAPNFARYGGRGITICNRWMKFENFLTDMGTRPKGKTLDRINVNGPYSSENCHWATPKEQQRNARGTVYVTFQGKTQSLSSWSDEFGIDKSTLSYRLQNWTVEEAFSIKVKYGNRIKQTQTIAPRQRVS